MANVFSSNPVYIDTDTTVGAGTNWRGASGGISFAGGGIRPEKIIVTLVGVEASGTVTINEILSNNSTGPVVFKVTIPASGFSTAEFDLVGTSAGWRDFIVTGVTATGTAIEIYYRV